MPGPEENLDRSPAHRSARSFVGRDAELGTILDALDGVAGGRGALFLVGGEAGIGKSRLADEVGARANERGGLVAWGRSWEEGGAPAYWPWIQVLRSVLKEMVDVDDLLGPAGPRVAQVIPELRERFPFEEDTSIPPEEARFLLFDAVTGFLVRVAEERPLTILLEDLHAADMPSLVLLRFLSSQIAASGILVVATYRSSDLMPDDPATVTLSEIGREPSTTQIHMAGLEREAVAGLTRDISGSEPPEGFVTALHRETEGNPLFVGEVVRLLASEGEPWAEADPRRWPLPEGVREAIGRRLHRLSGRCREVLAAASVIGRTFSIDALREVTGRTAEELLDDLQDAVAAGVIASVEAGSFRFAHALIRESLYGGLPPADRMRLHREVGEAMEALHADDLDPHVAEIALHFVEAGPTGDRSKAVSYATSAGNRAASLLAYEEAIRLFRLALAALRDAPDGTVRCETLLLLGEAQRRAGETPAAKQTFLEAAEIATRLDLAEHLARAALGYAGRHTWARAGIDPHVIPLLRQALDRLPERDAALRVLLMGRLAGALRDQPSFEPRRTLSADAVAMARRLGEPRTLSYALVARWGASYTPDNLEESRALADELDALGEEGDREQRIYARWMRFVEHMTRGEVWEAREQERQFQRLAGALRQPSDRFFALVMSVTLALHEGRFTDAEALLAEIVAVGGQAAGWDAGATRLFALFVLRREQGRLAELETDLQEGLALYPGYRIIRCMTLLMLAETGRTDEARSLLDQLAENDFAAFPKDNEYLFALTHLAEAVAILGDRERAEVLYRQLLPYEDLVGLAAFEMSGGPVARALGVLATMLGLPEADGHLERAVEIADRAEARPWATRARLAFAGALAASEDPGSTRRAHELLLQVSRAAAELGMTAVEHAARQVQERPGTPAGGGSPLTPRESEVAGLVAQGLSNRQIAEQLFISERTAETHVQHILTKLDFTSRSQIAAWAVKEGLSPTGT